MLAINGFWGLRLFEFSEFGQRAHADYSSRTLSANEPLVRPFIALFGLLAMVLSGLHAGSLAAHGSEQMEVSPVAGYTHMHRHADHHYGPSDSDGSADPASEQSHYHWPSIAAPQLPGSDLVRQFAKQILFPAEASLLHSGSPAPPLDPPIG